MLRNTPSTKETAEEMAKTKGAKTYVLCQADVMRDVSGVCFPGRGGSREPSRNRSTSRWVQQYADFSAARPDAQEHCPCGPSTNLDRQSQGDLPVQLPLSMQYRCAVRSRRTLRTLTQLFRPRKHRARVSTDRRTFDSRTRGAGCGREPQ